MEFDKVEVGRRIAKRRKELSIKQNALADKLNYNKNHLSGIEHGRISPSLDLFVALCKELDVTPDYLLEGAMHPHDLPKDIAANIQFCKEEHMGILAEILRIFADWGKKEE